MRLCHYQGLSGMAFIMHGLRGIFAGIQLFETAENYEFIFFVYIIHVYFFNSNVFYLKGFIKSTKRNTQVQRLSIINRMTRTLRLNLHMHLLSLYLCGPFCQNNRKKIVNKALRKNSFRFVGSVFYSI